MVLLVREGVENVMGKEGFHIMAGGNPKRLTSSFNIQLNLFQVVDFQSASCNLLNAACAIMRRALKKRQL